MILLRLSGEFKGRSRGVWRDDDDDDDDDDGNNDNAADDDDDDKSYCV